MGHGYNRKRQKSKEKGKARVRKLEPMGQVRSWFFRHFVYLPFLL